MPSDTLHQTLLREIWAIQAREPWRGWSVSRAGNGAGKGLEPQERLRELGKGLSLEQRRLRGDLVALHKSLTGGGSRGGGRALLAGNRDRTRGNGLRLGQGRLSLDSSRNFPMERVLRPWQGLPREVWDPHPWRCPRKGWRWHSELWAGDKVGMGHSLDSVVWEGFSNLNHPMVL